MEGGVTKSEPKHHPILFSTWSVQAILAGRKTQTRRVIKTPYPDALKVEDGMIWARPVTGEGRLIGGWYPWLPVTQSPYGGPGDRMWVRETFVVYIREGTEYGGWPYESDEVTGRLPKITESQLLGHFGGPSGYYCGYKADGQDEPSYGWRASIFMPRWASRILLEIDEIKAERLRDLSWEDALAEGIEERPEGSGWYHGPQSSWRSPISAFAEVWADVSRGRAHKGYEWEDNPWCWCVAFHVVERRDR